MPKSLELFLSYVINGLIIGNIYGLMALGLTLILGVMKIVNFAHGEFYMLGGYAAYICSIKLGLGPVSGILGAIISVFLIGLFVERALLTPFYSGKLERPNDYALLMTFSLSVFLMNVVIPIFGPYQKASAPLAQGSVNFGVVSVGATRGIGSLVAIFLMAALLLLLSKTRLGIALRAIAQDRDAAAICGIDVNHMNPVAFGIGALLLGVLESLGVLFLSPGYRDVYGFLVIVLVLLIKPTGLFGGQEF